MSRSSRGWRRRRDTDRGAAYGSGLSSRAFATPKIALVAPMPIVRERGAAMVKPGALMRARMLFMGDR